MWRKTWENSAKVDSLLKLIHSLFQIHEKSLKHSLFWKLFCSAIYKIIESIFTIRIFQDSQFFSDRSIKIMFFISSNDNNSIVNFSTEELKYISKYVLINYFERDIQYLFDKLPEHLRYDSDIHACLPCRTHRSSHTVPFSTPALIKYCSKCQQLKLMSNFLKKV